MKKIKIFILLGIVFCFSFFAMPVPKENSFALTSAKAMCVMEVSSNRVLDCLNKDQKLPMASTTKIMTAITAIESGKDLDEVFEISPRAVGIPGTSIYLKNGEKLTLRKLLYGLMLVSGNDASVAIGEFVAQDKEHFVDMMNFKARQIGAFNTHFENTHGLDQDGHYTTAYDLALITSYALNNPIFREIVSTKSVQITGEDGKVRYFKNKNKLLNSLEGACGVKTGFTDDAGRCLVSAAQRDGMTIVCVVLNCGPMFEESATLLNNAFSTFKMFDLTLGYNYPDSVPVEDGKADSVKIGTRQKFSYPLKEGEIEQISYEYHLKDFVEAPVEKHDEVGEIKIFLDNDLLFSEKIYTMEDVRKKGLLQKLKDVISKW